MRITTPIGDYGGNSPGLIAGDDGQPDLLSGGHVELPVAASAIT